MAALKGFVNAKTVAFVNPKIGNIFSDANSYTPKFGNICRQTVSKQHHGLNAICVRHYGVVNVPKPRCSIDQFYRPAMGSLTFQQSLNYSTDNSSKQFISATNSTGGITESALKVKKPVTDDQGDSKKSQGKGDDGSNKNESKWFSAQNGWKIGLICLTGGCGILFLEAMYFWGKPPIAEDGTIVEDEFSEMPALKAYLMRTLREIKFFKKSIEEPSLAKLLPDPLKEPYYQPKYTVILELTDVLVHPDWTLNTGWRFKKRPYVDAFLRQIGPPLCEIVIYTKESGLTAFPLIDKLDPQGYISYRLFRDATKYSEGDHVKDLKYINRDLRKVIVVDWDPRALKFHPQNAVILPKWTGNEEDRSLMDLASFIQTIVTNQVDDVRTVLEYYGQYDNPLEAFKENQRKYFELQKDQAKVAEQQSVARGWIHSFSGMGKLTK